MNIKVLLATKNENGYHDFVHVYTSTEFSQLYHELLNPTVFSIEICFPKTNQTIFHAFRKATETQFKITDNRTHFKISKTLDRTLDKVLAEL